MLLKFILCQKLSSFSSTMLVQGFVYHCRTRIYNLFHYQERKKNIILFHPEFCLFVFFSFISSLFVKVGIQYARFFFIRLSESSTRFCAVCYLQAVRSILFLVLQTTFTSGSVFNFDLSWLMYNCTYLRTPRNHLYWISFFLRLPTAYLSIPNFLQFWLPKDYKKSRKRRNLKKFSRLFYLNYC